MLNTLIPPMLATMVLVMIVWHTMYFQRIGHIKRERIRPSKLKTPVDTDTHLPAEIQYPAYNLRNLFEIPVIFFALCLLLEQTGLTDTADLVLAWAFVIARAVHSWIHCTSNHVMSRFRAYMVSTSMVWLMLLYTIYRVIVA